ncbi:hypothetical protein ACFXPJ_01305 [Streptomyces goshikiensis]
MDNWWAKRQADGRDALHVPPARPSRG